MKKFLKFVWGLFAIIGILTTAVLVYSYFADYYISIDKTLEKQHDDYVQLLRTSGALEKDMVAYEMRINQDSVRAKEIMDYLIHVIKEKK